MFGDFFSQENLQTLLALSINLILGLYGNLIYYKHLKKRLKRAPLNYRRSKNVDTFILWLSLINLFLSEIAHDFLKTLNYQFVGYFFSMLIWLPLLTTILFRLHRDAKERQRPFLVNRQS